MCVKLYEVLFFSFQFQEFLPFGHASKLSPGDAVKIWVICGGVAQNIKHFMRCWCELVLTCMSNVSMFESTYKRVAMPLWYYSDILIYITVIV